MNTLTTVVTLILLVLFLVLVYPAYNNIRRSIKGKRNVVSKINIPQKELGVNKVSSTDQVKEVVKSKWFWVPVIIAFLAMVAHYKVIPHYFPNGFGEGKEMSYGVTPQHLAADTVLQIIADCESGDCSPGSGRQFEDDGVTPYRNREGSSAIGKWQILASTHREICPDLDIKTETGNETCARRLYSESGTKHWEADPRSVARWKPKLIAFGLQTPSSSLNDNTGFVSKKAKSGQPLEVVMDVGWCMKARGDGSKFESTAIWRGQTKVRTFTTKPGVEEVELKILLYPC